MSSDTIFVAYFRNQPITTGWFEQILHHLWQQGGQFFSANDRLLSWEQQLHYAPKFSNHNSWLRAESFSGTLQQWLDQVATYKSGTVEFYDRSLRMALHLQPENQKTGFGTVSIRLGRWNFHEDELSQELIPPYLQNWQAVLHWAQVLCRYLHPIYVYLNNISGSKSRAENIEDLLQRGEVPDVRASYTSEYMQYLGPDLLLQPRGQELAKRPNCWLQHMPDGGVLIVPPISPYSYGYGLAYSYLNAGRKWIEDAYERQLTEFAEPSDEEALEGDRLTERGKAVMDMVEAAVHADDYHDQETEL